MELAEKNLIFSNKSEKFEKSIIIDLNSTLDLRKALTSVLGKIRKFTDIEATAIRLEEKGDYIYYVFNGFPSSFIKRENSIVATDKNGNWLLSKGKKTYLLECMCGNIIRGKFDSNLSHFTKKGSFWSNSTTDLLATTTEKERLTRTRNICNVCGYESVALIPISFNGNRLGLLQLNDHRKDMFSLRLIEFLEKLTRHISFSVQKNIEFNELKKANDKIKLLNAKLKVLADKDFLTGLSNRRAFLRILKLERNRSFRINKPFTLIMLDLDNFKKINDEFSHSAGDKTLIAVSKELIKSVSKSDSVARWGGMNS